MQIVKKVFKNVVRKTCFSQRFLCAAIVVSCFLLFGGQIPQAFSYPDNQSEVTEAVLTVSERSQIEHKNRTLHTTTVHDHNRSPVKPVINGVFPVKLPPNTEFYPRAGVTATDSAGNDLTDDIVLTGVVRTELAGQYQLLYSVVDSDGYSQSVIRTVTVVNRKPKIDFPGSSTLTVQAGTVFDPLQDVSAWDLEEGDLTSTIKVAGLVDTNRAGAYQLTFTVTDDQGEVTERRRKIMVVDPNTSPVLTGTGDITIVLNKPFSVRLGVNAEDREDGRITRDIRINGSVNWHQEGAYELLYAVTDSHGSTVRAKRIVTVKSAIEDAPVLLGVNTVSIARGVSFNPLAGVAARSKSDGDITALVGVRGKVNIRRSGEYNLLYHVTDSRGNMTTRSRVVTVKKSSI